MPDELDGRGVHFVTGMRLYVVLPMLAGRLATKV